MTVLIYRFKSIPRCFLPLSLFKNKILSASAVELAQFAILATLSSNPKVILAAALTPSGPTRFRPP